jgi:hypothetical protein
MRRRSPAAGYPCPVPTLDQLSDDQRAIIDLVLRRGHSYDDLAAMLGMPASRVRKHARDALVALAPRTAEGVDPQWRGQVADYLLGQQSGPQSKATRAHLKSSEPARAWALSTLDSLDDLYAKGSEPFIPAGGRAPKDGGEPRWRRRKRPGAAATRAPAGASATATGTSAREESLAAPEERPAPSSAAPAKAASPGRVAGQDAREAGEPRRSEPAKASTTTREPRSSGRPAAPSLAPEAQAALRRRRIGAAVGGLIALAVIVVLAIILIDGGEGTTAVEETVPTDTAPTTAAVPPEGAALELQPVGGVNAAGQAILTEQEGQSILIVRATLPPSNRDEVYEVWLYNDQEDAVPVGAQVTDRQGNFQGAGPLPADFARYRFIDVSLEKADGERAHSGNSVLRGELASAQPASAGGVPAPPAPGAGGSGGDARGGGQRGAGGAPRARSRQRGAGGAGTGNRETGRSQKRERSGKR